MTVKKEITTKICLCGEAAVGKTSLIVRYVKGTFDSDYRMTIGTNVHEKEIKIDFGEIGLEVVAKLRIWDIMGQQEFLQIIKTAYFDGADGIVAVCDMTRRMTLSDLGMWIPTTKKLVGVKPTMVLANKTDLPAHKFGNKELDEFSNIYETHWIGVSANTGENVEKAFKMIATEVAIDKLGLELPQH